MATSFWQGGRCIEVEHSGNGITMMAENENHARDLARNAGVELERVNALGPGAVRATLSTDRDGQMASLRKTCVTHHVYCSKDHQDSEFIITDSFFIRFEEGTPADTIRAYFESESLAARALGRNTWLAQVTDETGRNALKTANSAHTRSDVIYAEPNLMRQLSAFAPLIPSDGRFPEQWHLDAPADGNELTANADINAPEAWAITTGKRDVVICVADDGMDLTHPDFMGPGKIAGRMNFSTNFSDRLVFDDQVQPRAGDYHGTPCAGVAVAEMNGVGTVGVAPGCALLAVRMPLNLTDEHMAEMFRQISGKADVVSCSWGYPPGDFPTSQFLNEAIADLAANGGRRNKGLVFCVAAGNNNAPVKDLGNTETYHYEGRFGMTSYSGPIDRWIAAHPDVITVSASNSFNERSAYSSWGRDINVCAPSDNWDDLGGDLPGRGIVTTDNEGFGPRSDFTPGKRYTRKFGGTSSATPTVAGVCGLVLSANGNLTGKEVRGIVESTASKDLNIASDTPVNKPGDFVDGFSLWFGHGRVNAEAAVKEAAARLNQADRWRGSVTPELEIPDTGQPVVSELTVDVNGNLQSIAVSVNIKHDYTGDLVVELVSPQSVSVLLRNREGGSSDDVSATYTPGNLPALRGLLGAEAGGVWQLRVRDDDPLIAGTLISWGMALRIG